MAGRGRLAPTNGVGTGRRICRGSPRRSEDRSAARLATALPCQARAAAAITDNGRVSASALCNAPRILRGAALPLAVSNQLTLRSSVSSTSVTVITPGAGCSITSTATVSTAGAVECFIRLFAGARLGLALATVCCAAAFPRAALDGFLAFGRAVAPFFFWTFDDCFLRLAIVGPLFWLAPRKRIDARSRDNRHRVAATYPESYQQTFSAWAALIPLCPRLCRDVGDQAGHQSFAKRSRPATLSARHLACAPLMRISYPYVGAKSG
jgi:hypothetical protein